MSDGMRAVLGLDPTDVAEMPAAQLPGLLAALAAIQAAVAARLVAVPAVEPTRENRDQSRNRDRWLGVREVAEILSMTPRAVYRRVRAVRDPWDFWSKDGKRLVFSERGALAYMERRRLQRS